MKLIILLFCVYVICTCSCYEAKQIRKNNNCDSTVLNTDNKFNDTSKIIYIKGAIFDTLACMINGLVIDHKTYTPIKNADIIFQSSDTILKGSTNEMGEFQIFNNEICGNKEWDLLINHLEYQCSLIKYKQYNGGQWIEIKLKKRLK